MSFLIVIILFLTSFFLYRSKTDGDEGFWKSLFASISLKVVDYFCKGTPTKVVMLFLRGAFGVYVAATIGYPTIKAIKHSDNSESYFEILLAWDDVNWVFTLLFLGIVAIVVVAYLFCNRYESKSIRKIESSTERIDNTTKDTNEKVNQMLGLLQGKHNNVIQRLLPITIDSIKHLKTKTAYTYLSTLKDEIDSSFSQDNDLKAELLYWMGCCQRYSDEKRSRETLNEAYEAMKASGINHADIISGKIYVLCREDKETDAKQLADLLKTIEKDNVWCWIPDLHFSDDLEIAYNHVKEQMKRPDLALGNELMIRTKGIKPIHAILKDFLDLDLKEIEYENLPLWILTLSASLNQFTQTWTIQPPGAKLYTDDSERLFNLTSTYLSSLQKTEIKNILPDTEYLHALTGYCHDKDKKWIDELRNCSPSEGHREIYSISLSAILMDSGQLSEALKVLQNQDEKNASAGVLHHRMHVALNIGNFDDIKEVFSLAANQQIAIPDCYLNYFISIARLNFEIVKENAWKLKIENPVSEKAYHELLHFYAEEDVDVQFLVDNDDKIDKVFSPYIALVYHKYIGLDRALEKARSCLNLNVLDIRTYIYIDLLSCDVAKTKDLYHFLTELRKNGLTEDDRLLVRELNLAEQIQDYDVVDEITKLLVVRHPDNADYIEHRLLALSTLGRKEEINSYKDTVIGISFDDNQVHNVFNVFHVNGDEQTALEFLYQKTVAHPSQRLRDLFYQAWLNDSFSKIIMQQYDTVGEDSYILYSDEKDTMTYDVVTKGSFIEEFIGKKVGDSIIVKEIDTQRVLTINAVFNKYFKLMREIQDDIAAHKSKTILSIDTKEMGFEDDPLGAIMKIVGNTPEQRAAHEADLANYEKGELSLNAFVKENEPVASLYDLLFGDFCIYSIPDQAVKSALVQNEIDITDRNLVLDMSSVMVMHELYERFGLRLGLKILVPKGVINIIESSIVYETKGMPSFFGEKVAKKLSIRKPADGDSLLVTKMRMLKEWIAQYCEEVLVEEKLNVDMSNIRTAPVSVQAESLLLANSKSAILITEDWSFCRQLADVYPTMSVSSLIYVLGVDAYDQVADYLTNCHRTGQVVKSEVIYREYNKSRDNKENFYQHCITCIEKNGYLYKEAVNAAIKMTSGIIIPASTLAATSLLVAMFKAAPSHAVMKMYMFAFRMSDNRSYREALANALRICHPEFFNELLRS